LKTSRPPMSMVGPPSLQPLRVGHPGHHHHPSSSNEWPDARRPNVPGRCPSLTVRRHPCLEHLRQGVGNATWRAMAGPTAHNVVCSCARHSNHSCATARVTWRNLSWLSLTAVTAVAPVSACTHAKPTVHVFIIVPITEYTVRQIKAFGLKYLATSIFFHFQFHFTPGA